MSDEISIRKALIYNQTEAMRAIMDLQEEMRDLELERDALWHRNKCLQAEIHGLSAKLAKSYALREEIAHMVETSEVMCEHGCTDRIAALVRQLSG